MSYRARILRHALRGAAGAVSGLLCQLWATQALASDPLPGEAYAPAANQNILMVYDLYQNDNRFGGQPLDVHGPDATQGTRISANGFAVRFIHSYDLGGFTSGIQAYVPYLSWLGDQRIGLNDLGSPAPGALPSLGSGHVGLPSNSGFGQPEFSLFIFPVNNRKTGTYFVIAPWISPPISSFTKNDRLNPAENTWTFEPEIGFRTLLFGTPDTNNLSLELWQEDYFYLDNRHSAVPGYSVYANNIPPIYRALGAQNPVAVIPSTPATFRQQPTVELRAYIPYQFYAPSHAFISPGIYQAFGGKQSYDVQGGTIDSGMRTEETQIRLTLSSFLTPSVQVLINGGYDVAAHGMPYERSLEFRFTKFF